MQMGTSPDGSPVRGVKPYAANEHVPEEVLRGLVVDLADLGRRCFPQVYSVIRDTEGNSGLSPVSPMDGVVIPDGTDGDNTALEVDCDGADGSDDDDADSRDAGDGDNNDVTLTELRKKLQRKLRRKIEMLERRRRVGYTIDMSVNLGNSSHFDVNDASQAYSVWLEEMLGRGENWFFVLPNVHGVRPIWVGKVKKWIPFHGVAVKLGHGVAISWDGRKIRHCTSVSCPDGMEAGFVAGGNDSSFQNHLYGVFTAAKEKIVRAGRAACAATYRPGDVPFSVQSGRSEGRKKTRRKRKKKPGNERPRKGGKLVAAVPDVGLNGTGVPIAVLPVAFRSEKRSALSKVAVGSGEKRRIVLSDDEELSDAGEELSDEEEEVTPRQFGFELPDLEVGGRYNIPKRTKR